MERFLKNIRNAFVLGTLLYFGFLAFYYFTGQFDDGFSYAIAWEKYYENMIFSVILYTVNAVWIQYLLDKYEHQLFTIKRFSLGISGNIVASLLGIFISRLILIVGIYKKPIYTFLSEENEKGEYYESSIWIAIVISLIFYAIWYYKYRQEHKITEQKIIAGTASAKFDALKNQLDPHFLFNSLNVLTSLIEEDPYKAQKFTTSLSKVYRYVLEQKNKDLVSVDEELQFARTYVRLLKMRFEDSIIFDIPDESKRS